jgi:hypothetical protein
VLRADRRHRCACNQRTTRFLRSQIRRFSRIDIFPPQSTPQSVRSSLTLGWRLPPSTRTATRRHSSSGALAFVRIYVPSAFRCIFPSDHEFDSRFVQLRSDITTAVIAEDLESGFAAVPRRPSCHRALHSSALRRRRQLLLPWRCPGPSSSALARPIELATHVQPIVADDPNRRHLAQSIGFDRYDRF